MLTRSIAKNLSALMLTGVLAASAFANDTVTTQQLALEKESVTLIGQMEDVARDIHYNADRLSSLARPVRSSQWSNNHHLTQIKELVNNGLNPALTRLTEIQPQLKGWQQDSIDKMLASAKALAADTNSAILTHNDNGSFPIGVDPEYRELISRINDHAGTLVKTSDAAGDYASAHEQATEAGLHLPKH